MRRNVLRRTALALATTAVTLLLPTASAGTAQAGTTRPYCGITWGSVGRGVSGTPTDSTVMGVRTGRHACFDRVVVDIKGPVTSWSANYPAGPASGTELVVTFGQQPTKLPFSYTEYATPGYRTLRGVAVSIQPAGSWNGVYWNLLYVNTRARLPYRVFTLDGPATGQTRLVVDVAHRW